MSAKELAKLFHDTYEKLAPHYNYETREETRQFDENSNNGKLMIAVCDFIIQRYYVGKRNEKSIRTK